MRGESGSGKTTFLHLLAGFYLLIAERLNVEDKMSDLNSSEKDSLRARYNWLCVSDLLILLQGFSCYREFEISDVICGLQISICRLIFLTGLGFLNVYILSSPTFHRATAESCTRSGTGKST